MEFPDTSKYRRTQNYSQSSQHGRNKKYSRQTGGSRVPPVYSSRQSSYAPAYGSNSVCSGGHGTNSFGKILRWITVLIVIAFILRACA